jgi:hypothetical protein
MLTDSPLAETLQERGMGGSCAVEPFPRAPNTTSEVSDVRMTRPLAEETLHTTMSVLEVIFTSPLLPGFANVFGELAREGMHEGKARMENPPCPEDAQGMHEGIFHYWMVGHCSRRLKDQYGMHMGGDA